MRRCGKGDDEGDEKATSLQHDNPFPGGGGEGGLCVTAVTE